ncbi:hypothetical protein [Streptomyces sp. LS1784]|uniref:hypothetical protein n=1 Tax=Streptomyces sp. LS1784 TaxID=2851533 RepID=UPI001CCAB44F|nr:hypothetical protein [Streptomyces sp. LS1784]
MFEQPPPQVQPIDRTKGYDAYLKVIKETVDIGDSLQSAMPPTSVALGFTGDPPPSGTVIDPAKEGAATAANPITQIMDGPGGFYGPSFADPGPWACDGAPTPGCMPPPPPIIGGLF